MPKAWSEKDERKYEKIKNSGKSRYGKRAKQVAARVVNKDRAEEGRTKSTRRTKAKKAGKKARRTRARKAHRATSTRKKSKKSA